MNLSGVTMSYHMQFGAGPIRRKFDINAEIEADFRDWLFNRTRSLDTGLCNSGLRVYNRSDRPSAIVLDFQGLLAKQAGGGVRSGETSQKRKRRESSTTKTSPRQHTAGLPTKSSRSMIENKMPTRPQVIQSTPCRALAKPALTKTASFPAMKQCLPRSAMPVLAASSNLAAHCVQNLVPIPSQPSMIGPNAAASLVVESTAQQAAVLILWDCQNLQVVPLVGCGDSIEESWDIAQAMKILVKSQLTEYIAEDAASFTQYWSLTKQVVAKEKEWVAVLEHLLPQKTTPRASEGKMWQNSMRMARAGRALHEFSLFTLWHQANNLGVESVDSYSETSCETLYRDKVCLVCFEETSTYLTNCGHYTCLDCFTEYLRVSSGSGQGRICCPAFMCGSQINFLHAAHILFRHDEKTDDSRHIFAKLVRFELEKYSVSELKGRFCPSPGCGKCLVPSSSYHPSMGLGWNICSCSCGETICVECPTGGSAHPGISCERYAHLQQSITSGDDESEASSLQWVIQHSRPCPKCKFPIDRYEGCNHVRCQRCQFYFCWQCGRLGNDCNAYFCSNTNRSADQSPDFDTAEYEQVTDVLDRHWRFRVSHSRFTSLRKSISSWDSSRRELPPFLVLSAQLEQVLLWINTMRVVAAIDNNDDKPEKKVPSSEDECLPLVALETLKDALYIRYIDKPKPRAMLEQSWWADGGRKQSIDQNDLEHLATMNDADFKSRIKAAIREGIQYLQPLALVVLESDDPVDLETTGRVVTAPKKKKKTNKAHVTDYKSLNSRRYRSGDDRHQRCRDTSWKGKSKVSARRSHALARQHML